MHPQKVVGTKDLTHNKHMRILLAFLLPIAAMAASPIRIVIPGPSTDAEVYDLDSPDLLKKLNVCHSRMARAFRIESRTAAFQKAYQDFQKKNPNQILSVSLGLNSSSSSEVVTADLEKSEHQINESYATLYSSVKKGTSFTPYYYLGSMSMKETSTARGIFQYTTVSTQGAIGSVKRGESKDVLLRTPSIARTECQPTPDFLTQNLTQQNPLKIAAPTPQPAINNDHVTSDKQE